MRELVSRTHAAQKAAGEEAARPAGKQVNWDAIRQHILESHARQAGADVLSEDELQAAWGRRALQVAQNLQEEEQGERVEMAVVRLGQERYGLDVQYIFDIRPLEQVTVVPRVPAWVAGIVNLRGRLISAIDLHAYLKLPAHPGNAPAGERYLILVQTEQLELALLADEVLGILTVPASHIQEAAPVTRGLPAEYVRGVYVTDENASRDHHALAEQNGHAPLLVLLNLPALLASPELIVHEEIT